MIQFNHKRLPFLAAGLAVALGFMPALGEDKAPTLPTLPTTRTTPSVAKQVTLTGKVVDLHQFMTGERSQSRSPVGATPTDRDNATDRIKTPGSDATTTDRDNKHTDKNRAGKDRSQIMGLQTSTGLVMLCFQNDQADGIRSGQDQGRIVAPAKPGDQTRPTPTTPTTPRTPGSPATPTTRDNDADKTDQADKPRMIDGASWVDKQVSVTGTMYEKHGVKFLVVSKIISSLSTSPTTEERATTLPRPQ